MAVLARTLALALAASLVSLAPGASLATLPQTDRELRILRITPEGEDVPAGRQIVVQFDRPVVPLGRMERSAEEIPIEIVPGLRCQWRWLNTSALACQLPEDGALSPATRYSILVSPGITTNSGAAMALPMHHAFVTARPAVSYAGFKTWRSPGTPVLRVLFNQPVSKPSAEGHLFFRLKQRPGERIPAAAEPDPDVEEGPVFLPLPGEKQGVVGERAPQRSDDQATEIQGAEARRVWLITPSAELPSNAEVEFAVEPGLVSASGPERGVEDRVAVAFDTFPEFRFLGVRCTTNDRRSVLIPPDEPLADPEMCDPLSTVSLAFASPVIVDEAKAHVTIEPDLAGGRKDYDPWAKVYRYSQLGRPHRRGSEYRVWLPEVLRAYQEYAVEMGALRDEFGRALVGPSAMTFRTDHRRPRLHLRYPKAVLEKGMDSEVPIVVTNLDRVSVSHTTLTSEGRQEGRSLAVPVPDAEDVAFATPLSVREMLEGRSGAVQGRIGTVPTAEIAPPRGRFFAQVTPFQVHVKLGHFNTLVWVTDLATGEPVDDARVRIYPDRYDDLADRRQASHEARTDEQGLALLPGTEVLDPKLALGIPWRDEDPRLFVRVDKGEDLALLPLDRSFHIDAGRVSGWEVSSTQVRRYGHLHAWGTTAQGVYRAGDRIQYKLYVRNQDNETFIPPPRDGYALEILDPTGNAVHQVPSVSLSRFGAYDGEFTVPETGAVGWYRFRLNCGFADLGLEPMQVLVSDFTPSPFRVSTELSGSLFQPGDEVEVTTLAKLHAGGPYADAQSRVTANLTAQSLRSDDPVAKLFYFDVFRPGSTPKHTLHQSEAPVDANGERTTRFTVPDAEVLYGRMRVESAVRDDRGKYVASLATATYVGRDRFVGLRGTRWLYREDEPAEVQFVVVDETGRPRAGVPVEILLERQETVASRVKGAGNAYLTRYTHRWVVVDTGQERSGEQAWSVTFVPDTPGTYRVGATVKDTQGRPHTTRLTLWVAGKGQVVWEQPDDNSLTLIPEKEAYGVGDMARYLLKNPFPGATALVTVERYGVLASWVQVLEGSTPVVEFPIEAEYLPGFFLSVLVVSPRVEGPLGPDAVDLGKPTFRLGYAEAPVKDPYKQIDVEVTAERPLYKPGEMVRATVRAKPRRGGEGDPIELAVAVLDESVFDLIGRGRGYFDPYQGFYTLDGLDLANFGLLTRLVGRQKFEKKGANAGGGGGADLGLRSVFKFVSYWNPSIVTDEDGRAQIQFQVPDNLTGWRILALAVTPGDQMGLGDTTFRVNRPTELRPVMPNQVTEGDRFQGGFSVMNRTSQPRELTVTVAATGALEGLPDQPTATDTLSVAPFKRRTVWLPIQTKGPGEVVFTAIAGDALDRDATRHAVPVRKRRSLVAAATYGTTTEPSVVENVLFPEGIHTDVGELSVVGYPSVIGNVEGAFRYLRDYPYTCWEQILTQGVMAAHFQNLRGYIPDTFTWEESETLPEATLERAASFQAPNGGMVFWIPEDRYVSPYLSAYTALAFNWLRSSGYAIPLPVEEKLHGYLDELLRRDVMPDFYSKGMASTVRAVALAALAEHGGISLEDVERYRRHVPRMTLFGKAHYLMAALQVPGTEEIAREVARQILAASSQSGGKFQFLETWDDGYSQLLATPLRANCAILSGFANLAGNADGRALVGDVPHKLVRTVTQTRGNRDHWENTQENMFCMDALTRYSRVYESTEPSLVFRAYVDEDLVGEAPFDDLRDPAVTFGRPIGPKDPGRRRQVRIEKDGAGRLYYSTRLQYAPTEQSSMRINAGIEIHREYSVQRDGQWMLLKSPMGVERGELVRVDLFVSLPAARHFVVVDDPVPGGLEPVSRDLATASTVDADEGQYQAAGGSWWFQYDDWRSYGVSRWSFYHQELRHDSARFYSDYLGAGNYHLSYTAQAIAPGEFAVMPAHAEEMYDPDVFGKGLPATLRVQEPPALVEAPSR